MNNKELFKGHNTKLIKIQSQLKNHQTPSGSQVILGEPNQHKVQAAVILLGEAIKLINEIR